MLTESANDGGDWKLLDKSRENSIESSLDSPDDRLFGGAFAYQARRRWTAIIGVETCGHSPHVASEMRDQGEAGNPNIWD